MYNPATGQWRPTGSFNTIRCLRSAVLLSNGQVLAIGSSNPNNRPVADRAEVYDPATEAWRSTSAPSGGPISDGSSGGVGTVLLPNGKVLAVIGNSAELYDPTAGRWDSTGNLNVIRFTPRMTLLRTGKVLAIFAGAELYNPDTGTWSITGNPNAGFGEATLLPDSRVLLTTGYVVSGEELYNPATGTWSYTSRLIAAREYHTATLLQNGKVLVAGGVDGIYDLPIFHRSAELYDPAITATANPIDDPQFFVRQHYLDFLAREPEPSGLAAWLTVLNRCPDLHNDPSCDRITVSAAFFGSPEFQLKGFYVFRFYRAAFDRLPEYSEIFSDMQNVTGQTPAEVYQKKAAFADAFTRRQEFATRFGALSNADYVAALLNRYQLESITAPAPTNPDDTAKVTLTRADLIAPLDAGMLTRAQVLRAIADSEQVFAAEFTRAFVATQYYGYLRRTPEEAGYNDWLNYLHAHPTDFRTMVHGFVNSIEYRRRFGRP
ncbi:hypothetical protein BH18ACI2_BH18ACI2_01120 [soil metagenome]